MRNGLVGTRVYPLVYARYVLGSIFVLWLPGYTPIKALFLTKEIDNIERIALSIGMSLALVPIPGCSQLHPLGHQTHPSQPYTSHNSITTRTSNQNQNPRKNKSCMTKQWENIRHRTNKTAGEYTKRSYPCSCFGS